MFDKKLAQEEAWLRQGIKARRTRNEGRVRRLEALRLDRRARRDETGGVKAALLEGEQSGRRVLRTEKASFEYEAGVPIVRNVPVARALLAGARVGQPIPPALYAAVAEVLAFVDRVRGRLPQHLAEVRGR